MAGRKPYCSGVLPTDRPGTDRRGDGTDAGTEKPARQAQEDAGEDNRRRSRRDGRPRPGTQRGGQDAGIPLQRAGCGAEPLPNQTCRGTGDDRDTAELQPAAQIGGKQPQGHGDSGHRVRRADGRGHADGGALSVHETARDFGKLQCDRGRREEREAQGQPAGLLGTLLYRQRGGDKARNHQHRPVHPGMAGAHALLERPLVLARPGRMGECDVRQEHHRRHRGRLGTWILLGFYHQNSVS